MTAVRDIKVGDLVTLKQGERHVIRITVGTRDHMRRGNGLARGFRRFHFAQWPYTVTVRADQQVGHTVKAAEA